MPNQSDRIKFSIKKNAAEVVRLHKRIHETFALRDVSQEKREEWQKACEEFHSKYDELAFPGGCRGVIDRLLEGDSDTMEAVICFLEIRPYFFRSGYMFDALLRKAKRAPLSAKQKSRLQIVADNVRTWKASKRAARDLARGNQ
ncbi:hypothetical protein GCM10007862_15810 [Dyella lipolytica]|uniref:Uncharacterized protein n=1 Tax=Dyella lipolytica TaxID=1867835 RepID=A0ABW8ITA5_9GAMM|nr:hypothetical protein [Dyella lipolytica]GLQ46530.1 hypothetical protein GCM10007862_15810 [Dyella lipolytica]